MCVRTILSVFASVVLFSIASADVIEGRVVDAQGNGVADVEVAKLWQSSKGKITSYQGVTTGKDGTFELEVNFYGRAGAIMAMDADRTVGGMLVIDPEATEPPDNTITLDPLVEVSGEFFCEEFDMKPTWTNVYMNVMPGRIRIASCSSMEADFKFKLPAGDYQFYGYGTDVKRLTKNMTLTTDEPKVDMGRVNLPPTIIAQHYGKEPPPLYITDARDVDKKMKLEDFKGKWLLIEFWGYW